MLKMIKYDLKKNLLFTAIITIIALAIVFALYANESFTYLGYGDDKTQILMPADSPINDISIIACIICTIIPIIQFSFKMLKVSVDQMYSLPIAKEKLYLSKYLSGFIIAVIPVTIAYLFCVLKVLLSPHLYETIYFLPFYFCLIFFMLIIYSIVCFTFTRANTIVDGIINILFYIFVFMMIMAVLEEVFPYPIDRYFRSGSNSFYSPLLTLGEYFNQLLRKEAMLIATPYFNPTLNTEDIITILIFTKLGIASFILFIMLSKKEKAENAMQISKSWFSYRVMIPIYTFCFGYLICETTSLISGLVFLLVGVYIIYVIFRRKLKLNKWDYIITGICILSAIFFYLIVDDVSKINDTAVLVTNILCY